MRTPLPAAVLAAAFALAGGVAVAQTPAPGSKYKAQPLILQREQLGTEALTSVGRTRMRNGDCAGALDAFDAVLRTAVVPAVNRDRGLCHEQLGQPYPAIDDYRVYLTAQPDAPDADGIRQRLVRLEAQTTGRSSASSDVPDKAGPADASAGPAETSAGVAAGAGAAGGAGAASARRRDKMDYIDRDDDAAARSPYRSSKGWAFAPFFTEHKWFSSGTSFGDASTWSECAGLQLRYSLGRSGSLFVEAGFEHFNTTDVDAATISGLTSQVGYEFRFPLDPEYDDQLFLAPGVGYQHSVVSPTDPQFQTATFGAIVPRARFGYRHMIASTVAVEAGIDGGWSQSFRYSGSGSGSTSELLAVWVAVGWGL
jgi:hypothetical protein